MMDIGLDDNADLKVANGDFVVVESTKEHVRNLILCNKGEFKEQPTMCVGAVNYIDDENPGDLIQAITEELLKDGVSVRKVKPVTTGPLSGTVEVDGFYK